jgi:hypothetical protein
VASASPTCSSSLSPPLSRFTRCPTTPRALTPPLSPPQRTCAQTLPRRLRQLARLHDSGSHLPLFSTFSFACSNSQQKQIEQGKHVRRQPPTFTIYHASIQANASSAPTHTHIQIAHACIKIRHRPPYKIRHRPPCKVRHRPFACEASTRYAPHYPSIRPQRCHWKQASNQ